jgi:uncharacterized membrane protein
MKLKLAQFSTNILFALVMGVFWGTWFALSRSIAVLREQTFLDIGHTIIRNLGGPMSVLMPLSLLSAIVVLVLLPKRSKVFTLALAGFILMIVALIVTLAVEVPIDRQIEQWTVATLPSDWKELRDRWEFYHAIRTFVSIGALGFVTASSLIDRP